jgi:glutamate dehydrogenase/leucine dehydrogenase
MQGFGNLGLAAACSLAEEGVRLTALADEHGCVAQDDGLDVAAMLRTTLGVPVPQLLTPGERLPSGDLFRRPADVLILAGCADAMGEEDTTSAPFGSVVVGANCGLSEAAEDALYARDVSVVPDFIGGIGGSASMEALFGPSDPPTAEQVLDNLARLMRELVDDLMAGARRAGVAPRTAAKQLAADGTPDPDARPYGQSRYLAPTVH